MYQEISKLIMYGNMDQDCILYKFADIFRRFEMQESSDAQLTQDIYTQIKRLLEVATDYGFDKNLWHNYLTFILITNENPFSITCEKVGANDGSVNAFAKNDFQNGRRQQQLHSIFKNRRLRHQLPELEYGLS